MGSAFIVSIFLILMLRLGAQSNDLTFTEHLGHGENVTLRWGFDQLQNEITFELTVKTMGWVGLGFSPNGRMAGADIVIGGVAPNGSTYFTDRHAVGNSLPLVDKRQSCTLLSLTEGDGQTTMKFRRPMKSCDDEDFLISASLINLIYAFGLTDEIENHASRRGTKKLNLLKYSPRTNPLSSNYFDLRASNFTIPAVHTHYHCWIMKTPTLGAKHHIYRIEPIIRHIDIVHHIIMYGCHFSVNETTDGACYTSPMLSYMCPRVMAAWAVGGEVIDFPEVAGLSIGGEKDISYYRLEIHYNNPENTAGRIDDSGLRFYYTSVLRQFDASILDVGLIVSENYVIPPDAKAFTSYGVCNTSYFPQLIKGPMPDLNIFMTLLHTHLAGRKIRVGLFRNGMQVDFVDFEENYDFDLQQARFLGNIKSVKEGDEIVVECTYNTTNRTKRTTLGLSTTDEMCFAFLYYYPAIDIGSCWSIPDIQSLEASMGASKHKEALLMYEAKSWNDASIEEHQNKLKSAQQFIMISNTHLNQQWQEARAQLVLCWSSKPGGGAQDKLG
ncbi:DBH-like monooxygenase protein 2 homolog [Conger conger]|uniref:DBH-like monooxygenase protein 2 homolog n=1 Tax=Conger conger TaxID=82655 RepID=UPI002A5A7E29|nr:DBH-like monooxygenase protein 2 homolog [Conger conger]